VPGRLSKVALLGRANPLPPDRRLPNARFALEHECRRQLSIQERGELGELLLAPDELGRSNAHIQMMLRSGRKA